MQRLRVIVGEELWLCPTPDGFVLCAPTVRRHDGGGAPGLVAPSPTVLREGQRITLTIYADAGACRGCDELRHVGDFPLGHVFEHNHGPTEAN